MKSAVLLLLAFAAAPLSAQETPDEPPETILAISSEVAWGSAVTGRAVGFGLQRAYHHVTIAAHLGNGGGKTAAVAYLVRAIGPGTSPGDEFARTEFELPSPFLGWIDVFRDLELEPGDYWLIIAKPPERAHNSLNWVIANPMILNTSCAAHYLGTAAYTFLSDAAKYIPASKFGAIDRVYGFGIDVTGDEVQRDGVAPCFVRAQRASSLPPPPRAPER